MEEMESEDDESPQVSVEFTKEKFILAMKAMKRKRIQMLRVCQQNETSVEELYKLFQVYREKFNEHGPLLNWVEENNDNMPNYSRSVTKEKEFINICYKTYMNNVMEDGDMTITEFCDFVVDSYGKRFTKVKEPLAAIEEQIETSNLKTEGDDASQHNQISAYHTPRPEELDRLAKESIEESERSGPETVKEVSQSKE